MRQTEEANTLACNIKEKLNGKALYVEELMELLKSWESLLQPIRSANHCNADFISCSNECEEIVDAIIDGLISGDEQALLDVVPKIKTCKCKIREVYTLHRGSLYVDT